MQVNEDVGWSSSEARPRRRLRHRPIGRIFLPHLQPGLLPVFLAAGLLGLSARGYVALSERPLDVIVGDWAAYPQASAGLVFRADGLSLLFLLLLAIGPVVRFYSVGSAERDAGSLAAFSSFLTLVLSAAIVFVADLLVFLVFWETLGWIDRLLRWRTAHDGRDRRWVVGEAGTLLLLVAILSVSVSGRSGANLGGLSPADWQGIVPLVLLAACCRIYEIGGRVGAATPRGELLRVGALYLAARALVGASAPADVVLSGFIALLGLGIALSALLAIRNASSTSESVEIIRSASLGIALLGVASGTGVAVAGALLLVVGDTILGLLLSTSRRRQDSSIADATVFLSTIVCLAVAVGLPPLVGFNGRILALASTIDSQQWPLTVTMLVAIATLAAAGLAPALAWLMVNPRQQSAARRARGVIPTGQPRAEVETDAASFSGADWRSSAPSLLILASLAVAPAAGAVLVEKAASLAPLTYSSTSVGSPLELTIPTVLAIASLAVGFVWAARLAGRWSAPVRRQSSKAARGSKVSDGNAERLSAISEDMLRGAVNAAERVCAAISRLEEGPSIAIAVVLSVVVFVAILR